LNETFSLYTNNPVSLLTIMTNIRNETILIIY
jgi:hypothetical protein